MNERKKYIFKGRKHGALTGCNNQNRKQIQACGYFVGFSSQLKGSCNFRMESCRYKLQFALFPAQILLLSPFKSSNNLSARRKFAFHNDFRPPLKTSMSYYVNTILLWNILLLFLNRNIFKLQLEEKKCIFLHFKQWNWNWSITDFFWGLKHLYLDYVM